MVYTDRWGNIVYTNEQGVIIRVDTGAGNFISATEYATYLQERGSTLENAGLNPASEGLIDWEGLAADAATWAVEDPARNLLQGLAGVPWEDIGEFFAGGGGGGWFGIEPQFAATPSFEGGEFPLAEVVGIPAALAQAWGIPFQGIMGGGAVTSEDEIVNAIADAGGWHYQIAAILIASMNMTPEEFSGQYGGDIERMTGALRVRAQVPDAQRYAAGYIGQMIEQGALDYSTLGENDLAIVGSYLGEGGVPTPEGQPTPLGGIYDVTGDGGYGDFGGDLPGEYYELMQYLMGGPESFGQFWQSYAPRRDFPWTYSQGEYEQMMSQLMMPAQGMGDFWDAWSRQASPETYLPSTFYSLLGKSIMPSELTAPGEMFNLMGSAIPDYIATTSELPDINVFGTLTQQAQQAAPFLMSLLQGDPTMPLLALQSVIEMQQGYALPFLELLYGGILGMGAETPAGAEDMTDEEIDDFLAGTGGGTLGRIL